MTAGILRGVSLGIVIAAAAVIVFAGLFLGVAPLCGADPTEMIDKDSHDAIVQVYQEQFTTFRAIAAIACTALTSAVGVLWRANVRKEKTITFEIKAAREERIKTNFLLDGMESVLRDMGAKFGNVEKKIESCPRRIARAN